MFKNLNPDLLGVSGRDSEMIELALSHGFKGVDLDIAALSEQVQSQGMAKATRLLVSARLKVGSFPLPVRWQEDGADYQDDLKKLPAYAALAAELGCTRTVLTIEPGTDSRPYHENFEFHRRRITELATALQPFKIRLAVGFLAPLACRAGMAFQFAQSADELILLLSTVSADNVGLALDSWHWHLGGGRTEQLQKLTGAKILTVSLADAAPDATSANAQLSGRLLPVDGGVIDNVGLLSTLAELGYDGPVTPAPDRACFASLGRDAIVRKCGEALDQLWKSAGLSNTGKRVTVRG